MKIALLLFPNSKMGGILTVHENLKKGLIEAGHDVVDYYLSPNTTRIVSANDQTGKKRYCEGRALGIREPFVQDAVKELNKYDVAIFSTPGPSLNRAFDDPSWMNLFHKTKCRKVVLWHDPFWESYYPWVEQVLDRVQVVAAIQDKAMHSLPPAAAKLAFVCNHPLDLKGMGEYSYAKQDLVISPHQFKSWKKIHLFIQAVPIICDGGVNAEVYNIGIEYYYMAGSIAKRKPRYKVNGRWIWEDAIEAGMTYHGVVSSEDIENAFIRQKCIVDLSVGELGTKKGKTYRSLNYSALECMKYGGIPIVRHYSLLPPFSEDNFLVVDEEDVVGSTADLCLKAVKDHGSKEMRLLRKSNRYVLREQYSALAVANSIMERV